MMGLSKGDFKMNPGAGGGNGKNGHGPPMVEAVSTLSVKELMANQEDDRRSEYSLDSHVHSQSSTPPPAYSSRGINGVTATTKLIMATVIVVSVILGACIVAASYAARQSQCHCPASGAHQQASASFAALSSRENEGDGLQDVDVVNGGFGAAVIVDRLAGEVPQPVESDITTEASALSETSPQPQEQQAVEKVDAKANSDVAAAAKQDDAEKAKAAAEDKQEEGQAVNASDKKKNKKKNRKNRNKGERKNKNKDRKNRRNKNRKNKDEDDDDDDDDDDDGFFFGKAAINTMGPVVFHLDDLAKTILEHEDKAMVNCVMEKRMNRPRPPLLFPFLLGGDGPLAARARQQQIKVFCRGGQDQPFGPMVSIESSKEQGVFGGPSGRGMPMIQSAAFLYPGAPVNPSHLLANSLFPIPPPHSILSQNKDRFMDNEGPRRFNIRENQRKLSIIPRILDLFPPPFPGPLMGRDQQSSESSGEQGPQGISISGPQVRIIKKLPTDIEEAVLNVIEPSLDMLFSEEGPQASLTIDGISARPLHISMSEPKARLIAEASVEEVPVPFDLGSHIPETVAPSSQPPQPNDQGIQQQRQQQPQQNQNLPRPPAGLILPPPVPRAQLGASPSNGAEPQLVARRPFAPAVGQQSGGLRFPFNLLQGARRPNFLAGLFPPPPPPHQVLRRPSPPTQQQQQGEDGPIDARSEEQPQQVQSNDNNEDEDEDGDNAQDELIHEPPPRFMMGPRFHFNRPDGPRNGPEQGPNMMRMKERFMNGPMMHEGQRLQLGARHGPGPMIDRPDRFNNEEEEDEENNNEGRVFNNRNNNNNEDDDQDEHQVQSEHEEQEVVFHHMRQGENGPLRPAGVTMVTRRHHQGPPMNQRGGRFNQRQQQEQEREPDQEEEEEQDNDQQQQQYVQLFPGSPLSDVMRPPLPPTGPEGRQMIEADAEEDAENRAEAEDSGNGGRSPREDDGDWFEATAQGEREHRVVPPHFIQPRSLRRQQQQPHGPIHRPF